MYAVTLAPCAAHPVTEGVPAFSFPDEHCVMERLAGADVELRMRRSAEELPYALGCLPHFRNVLWDTPSSDAAARALISWHK